METAENPKPLNDKQEAFVAILLADPTLSGSAAYSRAYGVEGVSARVGAYKLLKDPRVAARLAERKQAIIERLELTAEDVLRDVYLVASADANELTEYRVGCCRYCYGDNFQYQRTPNEYRTALASYIENEKYRKLAVAGDTRDVFGFKFNPEGGVGFDPRKPPRDDCPECFGEGVGRTVIKDTRNLSDAGKAIYAGIKETRHGIEVIMRDKDKARDLAARHTGVIKSTVELTGKNGGPVQHATAAVTLTTTDPQEAAREYQKIMGG